MWGRRTAAAAWELQMGGEESMGRKKERRTFARERAKRSRGSGRGMEPSLFDANLDFFNLRGQQSQIKCFSRSSNLLFNQLLTLESPWIVLSEYTRLVFSLSYAGQGGSV